MKCLCGLAALLALLIAGASLAGESAATRFVKAAVALEDASVRYDSAYRTLEFPGGDVPANVGVCSDVVVRAYRGIGIDLQQRVHEDMQKHFSLYPKLWGLKAPNASIDHRRVPNLMIFFKRHGEELVISNDAKDYKPGDIVTWNLRSKGSLPHIGIVTDKKAASGNPLMMHNIGGGQVLEDMLFDYTITGHYRYGL